MHPELTNLLPEDRLRRLRREYLYRLAVVALLFICGLIVVNGIFLIPTYRYLGQEIQAQNSRLTSLTSAIAASNESGLESAIGALATHANTLAALGNVQSRTGSLTAILGVPHTSVSITGIAFPPGNNVTLTGTALTRDDLRAYYLALQNQPFVANINLPVSAYAAAQNASFTLTLTLTAP